MAEIIKLPIDASKLGYRRAQKRAKRSEETNQLDLFAHAAPTGTAEILEFVSPDLGTFERALLSDERGDDRAAELYTKAIEEQDCVADALCNLGIIESQRGNTIKAFDCFTSSLKHNPRHSEAHYNLANLYFDANDFRLAQLHFEMAVKLEPEFANSYFNLALVQAINNDPAGAQRTLKRYETLVSAEEAQAAREVLENLQQSLTAVKSSARGQAGGGTRNAK